MATESLHTAALPASTDSQPSWPRLLRWLALIALPVVLGLLFLAWPYQHWEFGQRFSVLHGWAKWVSKYADWQFCLLVPLLVGWLVWLRREELRKLPWLGDWLGVLPLAAGLFCYWLGYKADTGYPGFLAVQLVLAGMILLVLGRAWMRTVFFAWLFLFFAWPMQPLEDSVASPLRPKTAAMAAAMLNFIGVPAVSEGSALQSAPEKARGVMIGDLFSLDVDAKCSGINSLFALMMISALLGYLALKRPRSRLILFACSVPLAVAGNVARLLLLVAGTLFFGSELAVGRRIGDHQEMSPFHTFAGFAVFGVALAGMFVLCWLLEGREMRSNLKRHGGTAGPGGVTSIPLPRRTLSQIMVAVLLPLAALGVCSRTDISFHVSEPGVVLQLPLSLGDYQGREFDMTAQEKNILDEGVKLVRNTYGSASGRQLMATVILSGLVKRSLHRPEVCLPGQGWTVTESTPVPIRLEDGREITATLLRIFHDKDTGNGVRLRTRALNLYWYIGSDGTTCPEHYEHILLTYFDSVFRNIQHRWAMASIYIPLPEQPVGQEDPFVELAALEDARGFIAKLAPTFMVGDKP
jgi:exosortase